MHNIKFIRQHPETFDKALAKRGLAPMSEKLLALDKASRSDVTQLQELQQQANQLAKEIGKCKGAGEDADDIIAQSKAIKARIAEAKKHSGKEDHPTQGELYTTLAEIPNIPAEDVAVGKNEEDNVEIRRIGTPRSFDFTPKAHFELGEALGLMDFELSAAMSGSRFALLRGQLARLERALAHFMLDIHLNDYGYEEVSVPLLVRDHAMFGAGQLPKFAEDSFQTTNDYRLIPTAEIPLVNLISNRILTEEELPIRVVAYTPCFRSEAGAAGKDTRGMIRLHQFNKVEMVSITTPEASQEEHERMTEAAESILQKLDLPYRVVSLCTGDLGFCAQKTYDLEVWLPAQKAYREISSCSNCGEFQARRMHGRCRPKGQKETRFPHTLNGSGLAVGRTLVAILENYQQHDGSITIPEILVPYMGGVTHIG